MSKGSSKKSGLNEKRKMNTDTATASSVKAKGSIPTGSSNEYLFRMSHAPRIDESSNVFQMLPVLIFAAVIIIITRMHSYQRPMDQFFWSSGGSNLTDFFSYYKMTVILTCAIFALLFILYRMFIQAFYVKRSYAYIPMSVYAVFVLLSYFLSDYKLVALWGWNDRFEGTLVLLSYMIMLFYIINTVNSERNVKWIVYALSAVSVLLGLLGVSQALGHDFFRTTIGKKLITPSWFWDQLDNLNFTFKNKEIYQTVYNINYVSFYLTLLLPLFGLIFINSVIKGKTEPLWKKISWGALFALVLYNLIGSASSGGLMGMAVVVVVAIIVLNKNLIIWWRPVAILLIITVVIAGSSYSRWMPELTGAVGGVVGSQAQNTEENIDQKEGGSSSEPRHKIDYIETKDNDIKISLEGNPLQITTYPDDPGAVTVTDSSESLLPLKPSGPQNEFQIADKRFEAISLKPAHDEKNNQYIIVSVDGSEWPFMLGENGIKFRNALNKLVDLHDVPAIGWENNPGFGSGRGYIWSRTIPMLKETLLLGHGADTYCIYFPHEDYVGKYNSGIFSNNINIVVDKPHNMYFGGIIGTGGISILALLALWAIYLVQSFLIYTKLRYESFLTFAGAGIFLGICGFLVSGLVNDSTVSVMPMFYGLLGTGIAVNMILRRG